MPEFLVLLLMQVTLFSSITALIILAVKQIFKCRIPPRIGVVLWAVLLARLICPIFPESRVSVYNFIPVGRDIMYTLTNNIGEELSEREEARAVNPYVIRFASEEEEQPEKPAPRAESADEPRSLGEYFSEVIAEDGVPEVRRTERLNLLILCLYGAGILATSGVTVLLYGLAKRKAYRSSAVCTDEALLALYRETGASLGIPAERLPELRIGSSAMLVGCVKPAVICGENREKREASMVFAHELTHYRHGDNPILLFSSLVSCLFWYNPLIWIVRHVLREDIEVLCDYRTLEECGIPSTEYAMMLLRSSSFGELSEAGCSMSASGRHLKTRLRSISRSPGRRVLPRIGSAVLCAAIVMVCLTNPIVSQNHDYAVFIENYAALTGEDERVMHLASKVTVSAYLSQVSTLLGKNGAEEAKRGIGNGSLEKFKRICEAAEKIPDSLSAEVRKLKTDEALTNRSCAVLNRCLTLLLGDDDPGTGLRLLPEVIPVSEMNEVVSHLTETEAEALLSCYNRGVAGAEASFERLYTGAMMELILSRIRDDWTRDKIAGFYQKIDLNQAELASFTPELREEISQLCGVRTVFVCDPGITKKEEATLKELLGAAAAGQREDVYYLKECEDGCSRGLAERLFRKADYTAERMLTGYAGVGLTHLSERVYFPTVREDDAKRFELVGSGGITVPSAVTEAVETVYALGLIDGAVIDEHSCAIDMTERLSCGQSLYYAYKLVCSMTPIQ